MLGGKHQQRLRQDCASPSKTSRPRQDRSSLKLSRHQHPSKPNSSSHSTPRVSSPDIQISVSTASNGCNSVSMVLDEATASSPESFTNDSYPSSDNDSYSSPTSPAQQNGVTVHMDQLPKPVPILGPLMGYSENYLRQTIQDFLAAATHVAGRPLTQEEANALAYNSAKMRSTSSWYTAMGLAGGLYRSYATADTWRFPFWKPDMEKMNPDVFGPLRGQMARSAWRVARSSAYATFGLLLGNWLGISIGSAAAAVELQRDRRLKEFNEIVRNKVHQRPGMPHKTTSVPSSKPQKPSPGHGSSDDQDMSPAAAGGDFYGSPSGSAAPRLWPNVQAPNAEVAQVGTRTMPPQARSNTYQISRASTQSSDYDDASPTGGAGLIDTDSNSNTNAGSAWERIRQQAASGSPAIGQRPWPSKGTQKEQKEGSTLGDSFSFSATDEERQLAKAEAQQEFDSRLERERNGGDFENRRRKW